MNRTHFVDGSTASRTLPLEVKQTSLRPGEVARVGVDLPGRARVEVYIWVEVVANRKNDLYTEWATDEDADIERVIKNLEQAVEGLGGGA